MQFLDLREDYEGGFGGSTGSMLLCGAPCGVAGGDQGFVPDPPETVQARKLRSIPFLSNEEIAAVSVPPNQIRQYELNDDAVLV